MKSSLSSHRGQSTKCITSRSRVFLMKSTFLQPCLTETKSSSPGYHRYWTTKKCFNETSSKPYKNRETLHQLLPLQMGKVKTMWKLKRKPIHSQIRKKMNTLSERTLKRSQSRIMRATLREKRMSRNTGLWPILNKRLKRRPSLQFLTHTKWERKSPPLPQEGTEGENLEDLKDTPGLTNPENLTSSLSRTGSKVRKTTERSFRTKSSNSKRKQWEWSNSLKTEEPGERLWDKSWSHMNRTHNKLE